MYGGLSAWEEWLIESSDGDFKALAEIAVRVLAVPASEVSCERVVSRQGFIYTGRNNRMGDDLFEARLIHSYQ